MRVETKWAIIVTVVILLWMLLAQALGLLTTEKIATGKLIGLIVSTLAFAITYYMVTKEKRDKDYNGVMSWSEGFWSAARMTLIFIPISCFALYIYIEYLNPGYSAFVASDKFGKDPVNTFLMENLTSAFLFGGLFCLIFPLFTRKSIQSA
ncbi:MAG: DUF4199 domain-containing protein [Saprospiraceae bacterium]|nr:DUF4199 domain-containing protein [Saprospiraceae bacterium]